MGIEKYLNVSYKLKSSTNFDEFLAEIGVPEELCKAITSSSPTITLSENNGTYTYHSTVPVKNHTIAFKPGVEFEHCSPDGKTYKSLVNIEGDKVIHRIKSNPEAVITSEFSDDKIVITLTANLVTAVREFARI